MIDGRDPYTVPLFGPQGDVEKPAPVPPAVADRHVRGRCPPGPAGACPRRTPSAHRPLSSDAAACGRVAGAAYKGV